MKKLNLPNKLTVTRLFMVPVFLLVMFFIPGRFWMVRNVVGAIIFLGASITDAVDGHMARKHGLITDFGKFLDPLADKALVISAMTMIFYHFGNIRPYFLWVFVIVLLREFAVTGLRLLINGQGVVLAAGMLGKIKTVLQMVFIMTALLEPVLYEIVFMIWKTAPAGLVSFLASYPPLTFLTMAGTLLFTVWSCISYFKGTGQYIDPEK